jgi:hypothetical protein
MTDCGRSAVSISSRANASGLPWNKSKLIAQRRITKHVPDAYHQHRH